MKMTTILLLCSIMVLNHCNAFSPSLTSRVESKLQSVHQQSQLEEAGDHGHHSASRRDLLTFGFVVAPMLFRADEASAFSNKISDKYDDRPKRRGPQPKDLGVRTRRDLADREYIGLKDCGPAPNCFCSTLDVEDDPEHIIPAWKWPSGYDKATAFEELEAVVKDYQPGQGGVDGGGFQIQDSKEGYIYVQFEALKGGYIDDVEFAYIETTGNENGNVQVRSSSRVGYLDFGVNAKRLNFIAKALREKGWTAEGVDFSSHQDYVLQNTGR